MRERYDDDIALFYQDVPPQLAAEALMRARDQSEARIREPSPLLDWPDVPRGCWPAALTGCSLLVSFAASPRSDRASPPMRSTAGTPRR
ncbi:MAG: hypothetical protein ACRD12_13280 [Acidimicrobiales bacterium]